MIFSIRRCKLLQVLIKLYFISLISLTSTSLTLTLFFESLFLLHCCRHCLHLSSLLFCQFWTPIIASSSLLGSISPSLRTSSVLMSILSLRILAALPSLTHFLYFFRYLLCSTSLSSFSCPLWIMSIFFLSNHDVLLFLYLFRISFSCLCNWFCIHVYYLFLESCCINFQVYCFEICVYT